ncbi:hypothetical protein SeMB42_g01960 [Synchytrium endobioticum]|uniref:SUN domain-containing protein n=1 Tax=Synchytrium endobioticum TaxID=286115 RepID=A0A507D3X0_9FUNG|nr:hypothetical protein SeLEV6574_g03540 [Synchytrium endobioticum]TPX51314.1 hypothetical protein SeMB42_g01960 [Synchytrium endobioticum]
MADEDRHEDRLRRSARKHAEVDYSAVNRGLVTVRRDETPSKPKHQNRRKTSSESGTNLAAHNDVPDMLFTPTAAVDKRRSSRLRGTAMSDDFETLPPPPGARSTDERGPTLDFAAHNNIENVQGQIEEEDGEGHGDVENETVQHPASLYRRATDLIMSPLRFFSGVGSNNANVGDESMMGLVDTQDYEDIGASSKASAASLTQIVHDVRVDTAVTPPAPNNRLSSWFGRGMSSTSKPLKRSLDPFLDYSDDIDTDKIWKDIQNGQSCAATPPDPNLHARSCTSSSKSEKRVRFVGSDDNQHFEDTRNFSYEEEDSNEFQHSVYVGQADKLGALNDANEADVHDEQEHEQVDHSAQKKRMTAFPSETPTWEEWFYDQRLIQLLVPLVTYLYHLFILTITIPWMILDWFLIKPLAYFAQPALNYALRNPWYACLGTLLVLSSIGFSRYGESATHLNRAMLLDYKVAAALDKRLTAVEKALEKNRKVESILSDVRSRVDSVDGRVEGLAARVEKNMESVMTKSEWDVMASQYKDNINKMEDLAKTVDRNRAASQGVEAAIQSLSERVASVESSIPVPDQLKREVLASINEYLPSIMAVKINPTTGQIEIAPAFWQALEAKLAFSPPENQVKEAVLTTPTLEDFLRANRAELESLITARVDEKLPGAIVTKAEVLRMIERELANVRVNATTGCVDAGSNSGSSTDQPEEDQVPKVVSSIVSRMLSQHDADIIGRPDYALLSSGGRVITDLSTEEYALPPRSAPTWVLSKVLGIRNYVGKPRRFALTPELHAGDCFAFQGNTGTLGVQLARDIYPTSFSIDHLHPELAFGPGASDLKSAPKTVELYAIFAPTALFTPSTSNLARAASIDIHSISRTQQPNALLLAQGVFSPQKPSPQTFTIPGDVLEGLKHTELKVRNVLLRVVDNWGNLEWTCLYRLRVHGIEE